MGVAYFALGEKARAAECVQLNVDFDYETEISGPVLNAMRQEHPNWASILPAELLSLTEQDKEAAAALADYFEGHEEKAAEVLERLSKNSKNPAVFHALCLIEERRAQAPKEYAKVYQWKDQRNVLLEEYGEAFRELLPLAEHCSENGSVAAQVFLGDLYRMGWGVEQDLQKALSLFTKPAEQGDVYAQHSMGDTYYSLQDYNKAAEWYRKAADQGNKYSQLQIGNLLKNTWKDLKTAYKWYYLAYLNGHEDAQGKLNDIEGKGLIWNSAPKIPVADIESARAEAQEMYEKQKKRNFNP